MFFLIFPGFACNHILHFENLYCFLQENCKLDPGVNIHIYINGCLHSAANAGKYLRELLFASFGRFHEN